MNNELLQTILYPLLTSIKVKGMLNLNNIFKYTWAKGSSFLIVRDLKQYPGIKKNAKVANWQMGYEFFYPMYFESELYLRVIFLTQIRKI